MITLYFLVPKDKITQRMINVSTSNGILETMPTFKDAYIVECQHQTCDCLLNYPMYTREQIIQHLADSAEEQMAWWQKLLSIFSVIH